VLTLLLAASLSLPAPRPSLSPFPVPRQAESPRPFGARLNDNPGLLAPDTPAGRKPVPAPPDRWLAWDKFWHFSASFVSVGAGYHLCANRLNLDHPPAAGVSLGGTFGLGLGKELLDRYGHHRRFSWKDMAANALGIAAGYLVFVHEY